MNTCNNCMKISGWLLLLFGVIFLLADLKVWNFWGIAWWTVVFLVMGMVHVASSGCKACQQLRKK